MFAVCESGSSKNQVTTLGIDSGAPNLPSVETEIAVGANPTSVAHLPAWSTPTLNDISAPRNFNCVYGGQIFWQWQTTPTGIVPRLDQSLDPSLELYVCATGAGQINVVNMLSETENFYSPIKIDDVRFVGSQASQ